MIVDLYDAIDRMLWAIAAWIAIGAALATPVLLVAAWAVTRAAKRAWRVLRPHARRGHCAPVSGPQGCSCGSRDAGEAPEASEGPSNDSSYEEAA